MKLWMSSETSKGIADELRPIRNAVEKYINKHLEETGYKNEKIDELLLVIVLRDDDFSVMQGGAGKVTKTRGKPVYGVNLRIDYNTFKNATDEQRVNLILDVLLKSLTLLEEKGVENLEVVKEYLESIKH